jgi:hypothetical protein
MRRLAKCSAPAMLSIAALTIVSMICLLANAIHQALISATGPTRQAIRCTTCTSQHLERRWTTDSVNGI